MKNELFNKKDQGRIQPKNSIFLSKTFRIAFIFSIILVILLAIFIPTKIYCDQNNSNAFSDYPLKINLNEKSEKMISYIFPNEKDWCLAFGPLDNVFENLYGAQEQEMRDKEGGIHRCSIDFILKTNMLSEEDKETLILRDKESKRNIYNIYMGNKDGKDIIAFTWGDYPGTTIYTFESNLNLSFKSILSEFENKIGNIIEKDFLNGKSSGIYLDFVNHDNHYVVRFYTKYKNTEYVVTL